MSADKRFKLISQYYVSPGLFDLLEAELVLDWEVDYNRVSSLEIGESHTDGSGDIWERVQ